MAARAFHVQQGDAGGEDGSEVSGEPDGRASFEHIEEECGSPEALAAGAEDVGCADVAGADGADVLLAEDADQQIADGD